MASSLLTNFLPAVAGATAIFTLPIQDNSVVGLTARAVVRDPVDGESAHYETKFSVKRFGGGGAALVGAPVPVVVNEDDATWSFDVGVAANDATVSFTPGAGDTVEVRAELEYLSQPL